MFEEEIKKELSEKRYNHSLNVAKKARELAKMYGADENKAYIAGLLHDVMKEADGEKQLKLLSQSDIILSREQMSAPPLWHAYASAVYMRDVLGVEDEEIFDAVFYHTTGKADMPKLTKIIYLADMISEDRCYKEVPILRDLAEKDLDVAVMTALEMSVEFLKEKNAYICKDTFSALQFMKKEVVYD